MVEGTFYIGGICDDTYRTQELFNNKSVLEKMCDAKDRTFFEYSQKLYDFFAGNMGKKGFYAEQAWDKNIIPCEVVYDDDKNDIKLMVLIPNNEENERIEVRGVLYKDYRSNWATDDIRKRSHLRIDYRLSEENAKEFGKAINSSEFYKRLGIIFYKAAEVNQFIDKYVKNVKVVDLSVDNTTNHKKEIKR